MWGLMNVDASMNNQILSKNITHENPSRFSPSWVDLPCHITLKRYGSHDAELHVSAPVGITPGRPITWRNTKRGKIHGFSAASRRRMKLIFGAFKDIESLLHEMTLTYPGEYPKDGNKVKRDLAVMKKRLKRQGIEIAGWKLEYQKRGAAHFHSIVSLDGELTHEIRLSISRMWFEVVGSHDEKHLKAGTQINKIANRQHLLCYLNKYIEKKEQSEVPEGFINPGRVWGYNKKFVDLLIERAMITRRELGRQTRLIRQIWKRRLKAWYGIQWKWHGSGFTIFELSKYLGNLHAEFP